MHEYPGYVNTVRTWHAVLAVITVNCRIVGHDVCNLGVQERLLIISEGFEVHESAEVVLKVFHIDHST